MTTPELMILIVLPLEILSLRLAQRRMFWDVARVVRWRWIAYLIAVPATVAHELAHATMAIVLGVPIGRRAGGSIELFRPRYDPRDETMRLGAVSVGATGVFRRSLVAIAPFLLVPVLLVGINRLLLGTTNPTGLLSVGGHAPHIAVWRLAVWIVFAITLPMAAFPSAGDHVGASGVIALAAGGAVAASLVLAIGGTSELVRVLDGVVSILLLPAIAAGILLLLFSRHAVRIRRRGAGPIPRAR
jgi:hypothetical protein